MKRSGFTLLEVILSMSLAIIVLGMVSVAINVHLRATDTSRTDVEQAQLARTLLHRISDDLRNTAAFATSTSGSSAGSSTGSQPAQPLALGSSADTNGQISTTASGDSSTVDPQTVMSSTAGLSGDSQTLQVSINRMPRMDDATLASLGGDSSNPLVPQSDQRAVTYFVALPGDLPDTTGTGGPQYGLVRREMDSAAFNFSVQQGQSIDMDQATKVLAPEVSAIQFTYYDSSGSPYDQWDSGQMGALPTAVKIAISVRRPQPKSNASVAMPLADDTPQSIYSLLVLLPNSLAAPNQALTAGKQKSSGGGSSGATSGSGTKAGGP